VLEGQEHQGWCELLIYRSMGIVTIIVGREGESMQVVIYLWGSSDIIFLVSFSGGAGSASLT